MLKTTEIPEIQKAVLIIEELSEDEKIQEIARLREKQMHDEATAFGHAKREGIAEGEAKGRAEGVAIGRAEGEAKGRTDERNLIIEKMRKRGMSDEEIEEFFSD